MCVFICRSGLRKCEHGLQSRGVLLIVMGVAGSFLVIRHVQVCRSTENHKNCGGFIFFLTYFWMNLQNLPCLNMQNPLKKMRKKAPSLFREDSDSENSDLKTRINLSHKSWHLMAGSTDGVAINSVFTFLCAAIF